MATKPTARKTATRANKATAPRKAPAKRRATTRKRDQRKVLSALEESFDAMVDAVKAGNDRGLRFSRRLVDEIGQGRRELAGLGRRLTKRPRDLSALYHDTVDLARRGSGHASQLSQEFLSGARDAGEDLGGTTRTLVKANRKAAEALGHAVQDAARDLVKRGRGKAAPKKKRAPAAKRRTATRKRPTKAPATRKRATTARTR